MVSNFNRVIDKVRNSEFHKASKEDKSVYKGTKYLLLKNHENLKNPDQRQHLQDLLALNETINTVMILKDKLKHIWTPFKPMINRKGRIYLIITIVFTTFELTF